MPKRLKSITKLPQLLELQLNFSKRGKITSPACSSMPINMIYHCCEDSQRNSIYHALTLYPRQIHFFFSVLSNYSSLVPKKFSCTPHAIVYIYLGILSWSFCQPNHNPCPCCYGFCTDSVFD